MREILAILAEVSGLGAAWAWGAFLVFLRVGAMMALLPAFGEASVPQRVKLALSVAFTAIVAPAVVPGLAQVPEGALIPIAAEVAAGLVLGFGLRCFVFVLQVVGAMAAQATSLSQLFAGAGAEPQAAIGNILVVAGLALAVMAGLHVRAAELLILSYEVLPAGRMPSSGELAAWGLPRISHAFALAFSLAAPFTIASLVYNLAIGVINRAIPQLMVSLVGAPALGLGGLVLLALAAPLGLQVWLAALEAHFAAPFGAPR